jgi:hypothetical protein
MNVCEVDGKFLETIGAIFLAYVAIRAGWMEFRIGRHLHVQKEASDNAIIKDRSTPLEQLQKRLDDARQFRQKQFGFKEVLIVGSGACLIAVGCGLYLYGMLKDGGVPLAFSSLLRLIPHSCSL